MSIYLQEQLLTSFNESWDDEYGEKYTLVGVDGNAFAIMGYTARAMKECGLRDEIPEMRERATSSDYYNLIAVCDEYVQRCNEIVEYEPLDEDFVESTYKVGDKVFIGDADGYQGLFLVKGDIKNLPKKLSKYIRNIYFKKEPDIYSVEFLLPDGYHSFKEDYEKFYDMIRPILLDNGLIMLD